MLRKTNFFAFLSLLGILYFSPSFLFAVAPMGGSPITFEDIYQTEINTPLSVPNMDYMGILDNDYDFDGGFIEATAATISSTVDPANSITINADGSFTYTPSATFVGTDFFEYEVCDDDIPTLCSIGDITIEVTSMTSAPIASDDSYSTVQATNLSVPSTGILFNDTDPDGGALFVTAGLFISTVYAQNSITLNADGSFSYTPHPSFTGSDSFVYEVCDNDSPAECSNGSIFIEVTNGGPPVTGDDDYVLIQGATLTVPNGNYFGVLSNDYDTDGGFLTVTPGTFTSVMNPQNSITLFDDGSFVYTPDPAFSGLDSFEYEACDTDSPTLCATGLITIEVTTTAPCIDVELYVLLEGNYSTTTAEMSTFLNLEPGGDLFHRGVLPGQEKIMGGTTTPPFQPYNAAPWNYLGLEGQEDAAPWYYKPGSTDPAGDPNFAVYHPDVVDWVFVRFRTGEIAPQDLTTVERSAAALLMKDGRVQFLDSCILENISSNLVYVQIDHRNHMAVMSPTQIDISGGTLFYDFRNQDSFRFPTSFGQKEVVPGTWVMFTGDSDQVVDFPNYDITGLDNILWSSQNGIFDGYLEGDYNLNADVSGADKILWSANNGISNRVPKD